MDGEDTTSGVKFFGFDVKLLTNRFPIIFCPNVWLRWRLPPSDSVAPADGDVMPTEKDTSFSTEFYEFLLFISFGTNYHELFYRHITTPLTLRSFHIHWAHRFLILFQCLFITIGFHCAPIFVDCIMNFRRQVLRYWGSTVQVSWQYFLMLPIL